MKKDDTIATSVRSSLAELKKLCDEDLIYNHQIELRIRTLLKPNCINQARALADLKDSKNLSPAVLLQEVKAAMDACKEYLKMKKLLTAEQIARLERIDKKIREVSEKIKLFQLELTDAIIRFSPLYSSIAKIVAAYTCHGKEELMYFYNTEFNPFLEKICDSEASRLHLLTQKDPNCDTKLYKLTELKKALKNFLYSHSESEVYARLTQIKKLISQINKSPELFKQRPENFYLDTSSTLSLWEKFNQLWNECSSFYEEQVTLGLTC